jgi:integrase/recombinase XerD
MGGFIMYSTNSKEEAIIKLVGRLSLEFPEMDQLQARNAIEEILYKYSITPEETSLVASDIEDKLQMYLAVKRLDGLSKKTLYNYHLNLLEFASFIKKPISTVNVTDIRMYLAYRCRDMKPSSTNAQISILKSFFGWLHNEEYIPKNPMVKVHPTKEPKRLRHALTEEEIELLRQACITDGEKSIIEFLISTGTRLSELVGVNKEDINWYEMSLTVIGKGNKERKVYFSTKAKILLQKYLESRHDETPALFVSEKLPHGRLGGRSIEKELKNIALRASFDKSIFPHLLRHSFATHKINSGMPLHILQNLMGHESADTTIQIYAELNEENIKHEYKKIS